jgi:hypothetical protein
MKTLPFLRVGLFLLFTALPHLARCQDSAYDEDWKVAAEAAVTQYAEWGADQADSAISLFASGIQQQWINTEDARLADPKTAPAAIYAEALKRLKQVQASGRNREPSPDASTDTTVETLTISLKAAKDERAKLLNYIANLESGGIAAVNAQAEYTRGWNEAMAQMTAANPTPTAAAARMPTPSRSLTSTGSLTAPNDFAERRKAMAAAREKPPISATDRAALDALQRQIDQSAHAFEMERQMRNLNTEIRKSGQ